MTTSRPESRAPSPRRLPPWQLGIAALAVVVGVFSASRAGEDFNRWIVTLMWFAVAIFWISLWRMDVKRRRRLETRAAAGAGAGEQAGSAPESDPELSSPDHR